MRRKKGRAILPTRGNYLEKLQEASHYGFGGEEPRSYCIDFEQKGKKEKYLCAGNAHKEKNDLVAGKKKCKSLGISLLEKRTGPRSESGDISYAGEKTRR